MFLLLKGGFKFGVSNYSRRRDYSDHAEGSHPFENKKLVFQLVQQMAITFWRRTETPYNVPRSLGVRNHLHACRFSGLAVYRHRKSSR